MNRGLDSALTWCERAAQNTWLTSKKSFHAMRDHGKFNALVHDSSHCVKELIKISTIFNTTPIIE